MGGRAGDDDIRENAYSYVAATESGGGSNFKGFISCLVTSRLWFSYEWLDL